MKQENGTYLERIDHLRFFAALMVFFRHFNGGFDYKGSINSLSDALSFLLSIGVTGVSLFLFMSGFLFCIISDAGKKKINYFGFVRNRILRIFPLLVFTMFIIVSINYMHSSPDDLLRLITLQLNTGGVSWGMDKFNVWPIWTIAVEFQFYLIFPFIISSFHKDGLKYMLSLMLVMLIVRLIIIQTQKNDAGDIIYNSLIGRLDQFLIGIIFGKMYLNGVFSLMRVRVIAVLTMTLSICAIIMYFYIRKPYMGVANSIGFVVESTLWGFFVMAYIGLKCNYNHSFNLALSKLGEVSFSFYLLHFPVMAAIDSAFKQYQYDFYINNKMLITVFVGLPSVVVVSFLTFYVIERPFLGLRRKYSN